jgi:hypothetical protein
MGNFGGMEGPFVSFQKPAEFVIMPLDDEGHEDSKLGGKKTLQYWPDTIDTSQSANWQSKEVPGSPLPLQQWVNGSEHTVSFTAVFSRDMDGKIGSGNEVPEDKFNVDIEAAIAWLRMLSTNGYRKTGDGVVAVAPPTLWIYLPKLSLGANWAAFNAVGGDTPVPSSGLYCRLTEVGASRTNWFQSGTTRFASISLSFMETMQIGGNIYPYSRDDFLTLANKYTRKPS